MDRDITNELNASELMSLRMFAVSQTDTPEDAKSVERFVLTGSHYPSETSDTSGVKGEPKPKDAAPTTVHEAIAKALGIPVENLVLHRL